MTNIIVDKSIDNTEPLLICFFFLPQHSTLKKVFISECDQNHYTKKEQALSLSHNMIGLFPKMGVSDWLLYCMTN